MYKKILFLTMLTLFVHEDSFGRMATTTMVGSLMFPPSKGPLPSLIGYYKGSKITLNEGTFSFKENPYITEFFMLFTLEKLTPHISDDSNTMSYFSMPSTASYLCFKITKKHNSLLAGTELWQTEKVNLNTITSRDKTPQDFIKIPDHTLIILANPTYLEKLEQEPWPTHAHALKLPKIVFKSSVSIKALHDMSAQAFLASLDFEPFHKKPLIVKEIKENYPHIVVSQIHG